MQARKKNLLVHVLHMVYIFIIFIFKFIFNYYILKSTILLRELNHVLLVLPQLPLLLPEEEVQPHQHAHYHSVEAKHKL